MVVSYEEIYNKFLSITDDYDIPRLTQSEAYELMGDWLEGVAARPKVRRLFSSIDVDDEVQEITCALSTSIDEQYDKWFVIGLLANGMIVEWLKERSNSDEQLKQMFSGKETNFYAQSPQITAKLALYNQARKVLDKDYIRDHGWNAAVLTGGTL